MSEVIGREVNTITTFEILLKCGKIIHIRLPGDYDPDYIKEKDVMDYMLRKIRGFAIWEKELELDLRCHGGQPGTLTRYITLPLTKEFLTILDSASDSEDREVIRKVLEIIV
jgi:hypothetical protein